MSRRLRPAVPHAAAHTRERNHARRPRRGSLTLVLRLEQHNSAAAVAAAGGVGRGVGRAARKPLEAACGENRTQQPRGRRADARCGLRLA